MHEWGHYFEDNFLTLGFDRRPARDSAQSHRCPPRVRRRLGDRAIAAMALDNPLYLRHASRPLANEWRFWNRRTESFNNSGAQGWFNEMSVATFLYDLWDTGADGTDTDFDRFRPRYSIR